MKHLNNFIMRANAKVQAWMEEEEGMEIIQVLILLALGLVLVGVFMGFGDQIMAKVTEKVNDFLNKF